MAFIFFAVLFFFEYPSGLTRILPMQKLVMLDLVSLMVAFLRSSDRRGHSQVLHTRIRRAGGAMRVLFTCLLSVYIYKSVPSAHLNRVINTNL